MTEQHPQQPGPDEQQTRPVPQPSDQPGYQQPAYQQPGYEQPGYQQQPGYEQPGYQQQPGYYQYGYAPPAPKTDDKAVWALVSSIAGFVLLPIVLHVVGWVLANQSLRSIRESRGALGGDGIAKAARVLGIVGVILYSLLAVLALLFFAVAIPLGLFAASNVSTSIESGSETVVATSIADIDNQSFSHDLGEVTYDLTGLDFTDETVDMDVQVGAGTLLVRLPDDVTVTVDVQVGAGEIDVFGQTRNGVNLTLDTTDPGSTDGGSLDLDLEVGVGEVRVTR